MKSKVITNGDHVDWIKNNPIVLDKPLCKKPKYLDKVWVGFSEGDAHEAWVLSLTGGDFGTSMKQMEYGDTIRLFFPPKRGESFYRGEKTFWLMDIGIGKTKEECIKSYCKHDWFKRSLDHINHDRFWAAIKEKNNN